MVNVGAKEVADGVNDIDRNAEIATSGRHGFAGGDGGVMLNLSLGFYVRIFFLKYGTMSSRDVPRIFLDYFLNM